MPYVLTSVLLATVPNAAPIVPHAGIRTTLNATVSALIAGPSRSGVCGSPTARNGAARTNPYLIELPA